MRLYEYNPYQDTVLSENFSQYLSVFHHLINIAILGYTSNGLWYLCLRSQNDCRLAKQGIPTTTIDYEKSWHSEWNLTTKEIQSSHIFKLAPKPGISMNFRRKSQSRPQQSLGVPRWPWVVGVVGSPRRHGVDVRPGDLRNFGVAVLPAWHGHRMLNWT